MAINNLENKQAKYTDNIYKTNAIPNNMGWQHVNSVDDNSFGNLGNHKYNDLLAIPNWSLLDFLNERRKFMRQGTQLGEYSGFNDPGSFFYKLFFNFNTGFGLFGSIIKNSAGQIIKDQNNAYQYLTNNITGDKFSAKYKKTLLHKRDSLENFTKLLNFLTMECPWFFKEITGLSEAIKYDFSEIVKQENRKFTISFNQDAVDMRISTLLELYRDACFDYVNFKEVIPENLRKFDMCIVLVSPPIIGLNTEINSEGEFIYSKITNTLSPDSLTFKCLILKNCEINYKDLTTIPASLSNEIGFANNLTMEINFERVFVHSVNNELDIETLNSMYDEDYNEETDEEYGEDYNDELEYDDYNSENDDDNNENEMMDLDDYDDYNQGDEDESNIGYEVDIDNDYDTGNYTDDELTDLDNEEQVDELIDEMD